MDQTKIAAKTATSAQESTTLVTPLPPVCTELRSLDDWEMVLVGGGDFVVCW